jgi:hypothetical protein
MLRHRDRIIGAAFHRCVVHNDHAVTPRDTADAGYDPCRRKRIVVKAKARKHGHFEELRTAVEQRLNALAWQHFAATGVPLPRGLIAAQPYFRNLVAQIRNHCFHGGAVGDEFLRAGIHMACEHNHFR